MSTGTTLDFKMKSEIKLGLDRTRKLISSKILWENTNAVYQQSVLIEILINLKDLLIKADKLGNRISFTDDVFPDPNPKIKLVDVTDLISNFRDASCHNDSFRREFGSGVFAFNVIRGKMKMMAIGTTEIGSSYEDDIAYNMGVNILYLKRHIERAFNEVEAFLEPISRS